MNNCSKCEKVFKSELELQNHIHLLHPQQIVQNVSKHSQNKGEKKIKYKCGQCDFTFTRKYNLKVHIRNVHEGLNVKSYKSYICKKCNYVSDRNDELKLHDSNVHVGLILKCKLCNSHYITSPQTFKLHIKRIHMEGREITEETNLIDYVLYSNKPLFTKACTR